MKTILVIIAVLFLLGAILLVWALCRTEQEYAAAGKEPNIATDLLSADNIRRITSYRTKYQKFPGPSNVEVADVARTLIATHLPQESVEQILGRPSSISVMQDTRTEEDLTCWAYDIGDSRRMTLCFDTSGTVRSIRGAGVGFDVMSDPTYDQLQAETRQEREQASEAILKEHDALIQHLIELSDKPDPSEFSYYDWHDSKHLAILLLAELRAAEAVDVLLEHLEYKNFHDVMRSYVSLAERHPAAEALSKIGMPAIRPTIEKLGRYPPNSRGNELCCWVIKKILGAKLGKVRLEMAIEEARDEAVKQNLKAVLPYFNADQEKAAEEHARREKGAG